MEEEESKVADWVIHGDWNYNRLCTLFSSQVIQKLVTLLPPTSDAGRDVLVWNASSNGIFSIKSAYRMMENTTEVVGRNIFKRIWKWNGAERIRVFMWIAVQNRLPTNLWRSRWTQDSSLCPDCNKESEDVLHILRDCAYAQGMWRFLIEPKHYPQLFSASLRDWFALNLNQHLGRGVAGCWHLIWGVSIWKLWHWRNSLVFDDSFVKPIDPAGVILNCWRNYVQVQSDSGWHDLTKSLALKWVPPPHHYVKLNVDGAVTKRGSRAGCGGVLRDDKGEWIVGFSHYVGSCSVFESEAWGLFKGLQLAWDLGFRRVIAESDARNLVEVLHKNQVDSCSLLLLRIKSLLRSDWDLQVKHISRDQNRIADLLAKEGISKSLLYDTCPSLVRTLLTNELLGHRSPGDVF